MKAYTLANPSMTACGAPIKVEAVSEIACQPPPGLAEYEPDATLNEESYTIFHSFSLTCLI